MKKYIKSSTTQLTDDEKELIQGQCWEAYDNYLDEYSVKDMAEIVWEHVEWMKEEDDELDLSSGNLTRAKVIRYAKEYIENNLM